MARHLTEPATQVAASSSRPALEAEPTTRLPARSLVVAAMAAVVPVLWAAARAVARGWKPTSDNAYIAIRAADVLSGHPPLVGAPSSLSEQVGRNIYSPGALPYDLLAVPVRLLGPGPGTALGIALVNALAIVGIAWLLRRSLGTLEATVAMAAVALLVLAIGSELLYDPWYTHATLLPFALFTVAVWCVVAGDPAALVVAVVAGSYAAQYHLALTVPVVGLGLAATVVAVVRLLRQRRDASSWPARRRRAAIWAAATAGTALACWAQPLAQQLVGSGEGNLTALVRAAGTDLAHPTAAEATRVLGGTVALPPAWLPPSFGSPSFDPDGSGRPTLAAAAALLALAAVLVGLGWRAWRRDAVALAAGTVAALAALGVALVTLLRLPLTFGVVTYYVRWLWPVGMVVWLVVVLALLDEAVRRRPSLARRSGLVAAMVAVVVGVAALPTVDNGTVTPAWPTAAVEEMGPEVIAAVDGQGTVLVDIPIDWPSIHAGPPLLAELQRAGIPFRVPPGVVARQVGLHRMADPDDVALRLSVRGGPPRPRPGEQVVASWSGLSAADRVELERLTGGLARVIGRGGIRLRPQAERTYADLGLDDHLARLRQAASDPEALLGSDVLWAAVRGYPAQYAGGPLVDESGLPPGALERWAGLAERRDREQVAVYVQPGSPAGRSGLRSSALEDLEMGS